MSFSDRMKKREAERAASEILPLPPPSKEAFEELQQLERDNAQVRAYPRLPIENPQFRRAFPKKGSVNEWVALETNGLREIAALWIDTMRGRPICVGYKMDSMGRAIRGETGTPHYLWEWPTHKQRMQAAAELANRFGLPNQQVVKQEVTHRHISVKHLSDEDLRALVALHQKIPNAEQVVDGEFTTGQPDRPVLSESNSNESVSLSVDMVPGDVVGT